MSEFDDAISDALDESDSSGATTTDPDPTDPAQDDSGPPEDDGPEFGATTPDPDPTDPAQDPSGPPEDDEDDGDRVTTTDPDPTDPAQDPSGPPEDDDKNAQPERDSDATARDPDPTDPAQADQSTGRGSPGGIDSPAFGDDNRATTDDPDPTDPLQDRSRGGPDIRRDQIDREITDEYQSAVAQAVANERESVSRQEVTVTEGDRGLYIDFDREGPTTNRARSAEPSVRQPSTAPAEARGRPFGFAEPSPSQASTPDPDETQTRQDQIQAFRERAADELDVSEDEIIIQQQGDELQASVEGAGQTRRGAETGITGVLGVDPDAEPQGSASILGGAAQTIRDETIPEPVDTTITEAAESFRSGRLGELTDRGSEALEPAAERIDEELEATAESAGDVTIAGPGGRTVSPTFLRGGVEGAQALNPARFGQDIIRAPEVTVRAVEGATGEDAASNIQTAADVGEAGAEVAAEEGPEFVRENPGRAAEIAIGGGAALATGAVAGTASLRGAQAAGRTAARARRVDVDLGGASRRVRRDLDEIEVETTTDADAPRLEVDGRSGGELVSDAASAAARRVGRANEPGQTTTPSGTFGRPTPESAGSRSLSGRAADAVDDTTTLDFRRSRRTFGRPLAADSDNVPLAERALDALDRPETIDLTRSRRTFGRPLSRDTDNEPISQTLARVNEPGGLTGSRGTFGRPLSADTDAPSLSSDTVDVLRRFNDASELTTSRATFGRPLAADSDNVPLAERALDALDRPETIDLQRSRRTFGRPAATDTDNIAVSEAFARANAPGELTESRGVFGRPTAADTDNVPLSERAAQANQPEQLTSSRGVFGRPAPGDTGSSGFADLAEIRGIRVTTGRGSRRVDAEDLEGPDPAEGAPVVRNRPLDADPDADATQSASGSGRIDSTVDVGDGQVARIRQRPGDVDATDAVEDAARSNRDQVGGGVAGIGAGAGVGSVAEGAVSDLVELNTAAEASSFEAGIGSDTATGVEGTAPFESVDVADVTIQGVAEEPVTIEQPSELTQVDEVQTQTTETTTRQASTTQQTTGQTETPTVRRRGAELPEFDQPERDEPFAEDPLAGVQAVEARLAERGGQNE